jgi:PAS domain S-box-containing protein
VKGLPGLADALLASEADAIVASDREGRITFWNPGATRIFGHTADEALGQSLDLIIPEPQRARHWEGYRRVVATGESRYGGGDLLAVPALRRDGVRISIEFTIIPVKEPGGRLTSMVSVIRDVTARFEETRQLRRRLAAVEAHASDRSSGAGGSEER